jgi:hypothetical protein
MNNFIGLQKVSIIAINPTEKEYTELFQEEPEEIKYTWEYKGVRNVKLDFYLKSPQEDIFKYSIYLKDEEKVSKTGKNLYINCIGNTQWVEDESQLWESFTTFEKILSWENGRPKDKKIIGSKDYHPCKIGEDDLLHLLSIVQNIDPYNPESNVFLDLDKLFEGDYTELKSKITDKNPFHLIALAYVNNEGEQKIWKEFLPVEMLREINVGSFSKTNQRIFNSYKKNIENEYGGIEGTYILSKMREMKDEDVVIKYNPTDDGMDYDSSLND